MMIDFRPSDLIDRLEWDDPDLPVFMRVLDKLSHPVTVDNGHETVLTHVITVQGLEAKKPWPKAN